MSGVSLKLFPGESFEGIRFPDAVIPVAVSPKISYPDVLKPVLSLCLIPSLQRGLYCGKDRVNAVVCEAMAVAVSGVFFRWLLFWGNAVIG